jgi:metallophosphoesterase superfamily enzyme
MSTVLSFGDNHFPYDLPEFLDHLKYVCDIWQPDIIANTGDMFDHHAINFHGADPDAPSHGLEIEKAIARAEKYYREFPNLKMVMGNHDALIWRRAMKAGLSRKVLKDYKEIFEMPNGWEIYDDYYKIDGVMYIHGEGAMGMNGSMKMAQSTGMSVVKGHAHGRFDVVYHGTENDLIFGVSGGCGVDRKAIAMKYGAKYKFTAKPILGCTVIHDGRDPMLFPMDLGRKDRLTGLKI